MHPLLSQKLGKKATLSDSVDPRILHRLDGREYLSKQDLSNICSNIFKHAGRETSLAYHIASGLRAQSITEYSSTVLDAIWNGALFEPFDYMDWHELDQEEWEAVTDTKKPRLMWEWETEFKLDGKVFRRYPCGRARWERFQAIIEHNPAYADKVKRLALSRWMTTGDLKWIATNLTSLTALDLRDIHDRAGETPPNEDDDSIPQGLIDWDGILAALQDGSSILHNLDWLAAWDWRGSKAAKTVANTMLQSCKNLKTLCIAGRYVPEPVDPRLKDKSYDIRQGHVHATICDFILGITQNCPDTVKTLELRLHVPFMRQLLESLGRLKPNIERVGIDIGACVQMHPITHQSQCKMGGFYGPDPRYDTTKEHIDDAAVAVAELFRFNIYRDAHNSVLGQAEKWLLPKTQSNRLSINKSPDLPYYPTQEVFYHNWMGTQLFNIPDFPPPMEERCLLRTGTEKSDEDFHKEMGAQIRKGRAIWSPRFLIKLYEARNSGKRKDGTTITLFPLDADPGDRGTDPVSLLSILQHLQPEEWESDVFPVYSWLEKTFRWRPVFDWDPFVRGGHHGLLLEREESNIRPDDVIARVKAHFEAMSKAGMPIHLLIGRRECHGSISSCYWGLSYNTEHQDDGDSHDWDTWAQEDFNARLADIAPLVDTLTIFYDLRNPLKYADLNWIDALEPYEPPSSTCPFFLASCPWQNAKQSCPFSRHRSAQRDPSRKYPLQKIANKAATRNDDLAKWSPRDPSLGENAREHAKEDDSDDDEVNPPLHRLARRTVYLREAVGWQRFWRTYALKFVRLSTLNVRMPRAFDCIGSWRLALLLDKKFGWDMKTYTDERNHLQFDADLRQSLGESPVFEHEAQLKDYPAGRFVRRSWFLHEQKNGKLVPRKTRPPDRVFTNEDWASTQPMEDGELNRAYQRANSAFKQEEEKTKSLVARKRESFEKHVRESGQPTWHKTLTVFVTEIRQEQENIEQRQDLDQETKERYRAVLTTTTQRLEAMAKQPIPIKASSKYRRGFVAHIQEYSGSFGTFEELMREHGEEAVKKWMNDRSLHQEIPAQARSLALQLLGGHVSEEHHVAHVDDETQASAVIPSDTVPAPPIVGNTSKKRSRHEEPKSISPEKTRFTKTSVTSTVTTHTTVLSKTKTMIDQQPEASNGQTPQDTFDLVSTEEGPGGRPTSSAHEISRTVAKSMESSFHTGGSTSTSPKSSKAKRKSPDKHPGIPPTAGVDSQPSREKRQKISPIISQPETRQKSSSQLPEETEQSGQLDESPARDLSLTRDQKLKSARGRLKKKADPNFVQSKDDTDDDDFSEAEDADDDSLEDLGTAPKRGKSTKGRSKKNPDPNFRQPKSDSGDDSPKESDETKPTRGRARGRARGSGRGKGTGRGGKATEASLPAEDSGSSATHGRGKTRGRPRGARAMRGGRAAKSTASATSSTRAASAGDEGEGGEQVTKEDSPKRELRSRAKNVSYKT